jgi:hypothetical protein
MSKLLDPITRANAELDRLAERILGSQESAARDANAMAQTLLAMDNSTLSQWLQANAAKLEILFGQHATVGNAINTALTGCREILGITATASVDTSPVVDKLARQRRVVDWQTLTVSDLPPEPEPEPQLVDG